MTSHKPTAGFWITVALVAVLVGYPLSFGPACWISSRTNYGAKSIPVIYRPICFALAYTPESMTAAIRGYAKVLAAEGWSFGITEDWEWSQKIPFNGHIDSVYRGPGFPSR